jgi:iron complex transport system substrate-binding protein
MNSRQLLFVALLGCSLLLAGLRVHAARNIVSLDLCSDWMLLKFADPAQVRAFSPLLYKYQADWVPDGLPVHDGSLEHILQLDVGMLISGEYNAILLRKRLRQLGKQVEVLALPTTLDGIRRYQADFVELIDADPHAVAVDWDRTYAPRNQSLLLLGANGIGTGVDTLENDLLRKAGWDNYIDASGYVSLRMEQIVADPPDAIYSSAPLSNSLANLFTRHPVVRSLMPQDEAPRGADWRWECPGPWSLELIQELASWQGS